MVRSGSRYSGGGSGGSGFTFQIAPSDAPQWVKDRADLVLDGITDGTAINAFIQANKVVDVFETYDQIQLSFGPGTIVIDVPIVFNQMVADIFCAGPEVATNIWLNETANCDLVQVTGTNSRVNVYGGHWNGRMLFNGDLITEDIASVTANTIVVTGDITSTLDTDRPIYIYNSTGKDADGYFTIVSAVFGGGNTTITVNETVTTGLASSGILQQNSKSWNVKSVTANTIVIEGEAAASVLTANRPVRIANSTDVTNDSIYGVASVATNAGDTVITVVETLTTGLALNGLVTQSPALFYGEKWMHSQVRGAIFEGSRGSGVLITGGEQVTFKECTPKVNTDCGILLAPRDGQTVTDIRISDPTVFGYRRGSLAGLCASCPAGRVLKNLWIEDGTIEDCFRYGILLTGQIDNFRINGNTFDDGSWDVAGRDGHIRIEGRQDSTGSKRGFITGNVFDTNGSYEGETATAKSCVDMHNSNDSVIYPSGIIIENNSWTGTQPFQTKSSISSAFIPNANGIEDALKEVSYPDVAALNTTFYVAAQDISGGDVTINFDETEQADFPRSVLMTPTDAALGDLTVKMIVTYVDENGITKAEQIGDGTAGGVTFETLRAYNYIKSIKIRPTGQAAGDTCALGVGSRFILTGKLPENLTADEDMVVSVIKNGAPYNAPDDVLKSYKMNTSTKTIDFATESDGTPGTAINANDDFMVKYKTTTNILID